jgi:hypothetical protein
VAYFLDLSPYVYAETDRERLNVGWLDDAHTFPKAPVDPSLRNALVHLLKFQVNETRGSHSCVFCGRRRIFFRDDDGVECLLGAAELHVDGADGSGFAAPSLIVHYVIEHGYHPPDSFRRAAVEYAKYYGMPFES